MEYAFNAGPARVMTMLYLSPCKDVSSGFVTIRMGEFTPIFGAALKYFLCKESFFMYYT